MCCRGGTHCQGFSWDAFEEVTDPALLFLLRVGEQQQLFSNGHVVVHLAGHNDFFLSVKVVFVELDVAAATFEGRRRLENLPQGSCAGLAAGGEVVECDDELVAFVADVVRAFA